MGSKKKRESMHVFLFVCLVFMFRCDLVREYILIPVSRPIYGACILIWLHLKSIPFCTLNGASIKYGSLLLN